MEKLLIEPPLLCEGKYENTGDDKHFYVSGIYLKANKKNLNNRIYPESILKPDIQRYITEIIATKNAYGELEHPADRVNVDPLKIAHRVISLDWDGDMCYGKSVITPTPNGKIVEALLSTGGSIGMSSRGRGDIDNYNTITRYNISAVDLVLTPSVFESAMHMLYENNQLILDAGGNVQKLEQLQKDIKKFDVSFEVGNSVIYTTVLESKLEDLKKYAKHLLIY